MDRKTEAVHYHIRWAQISLLDWQSFSTRVTAEENAKQLKRFGETIRLRDTTKTASDARTQGKRNP
jgi:hypothetical protein